MQLALVTLILFSAFLAICIAVWLFFTNPRQRDVEPAVSLRGELATTEAATVDGPLGRVDNAFHRLLMESHLGLDPTTALLLMVGAGVCVGGAVLLIHPLPWLVAAGGLIGFLAPLAFFAFRRRQRFRQMDEGLPDAIDMMARAVHAGETLEQAVTMVGGETRGPLGEELQHCSRQLKLGLPVSTCMRGLSVRVPLLGVRTLASTLAVHRSTGGNLAMTLERLAEVVRGRINFQRQVRATTSAGRLSGYFIAAAGPILFVAIMFLQPEHVQRLLLHGAGRTLLAIAVILEVVGFVWLKSLMRQT